MIPTKTPVIGDLVTFGLPRPYTADLGPAHGEPHDATVLKVYEDGSIDLMMHGEADPRNGIPYTDTVDMNTWSWPA